MSAKLIKIRTIIDFFLLNSNLSRELLIKRINKLIKIHNTQVKQGRFHEDAMEYISTAEQLIFLKNTKKRVYEFFEGTEYEDIIKLGIENAEIIITLPMNYICRKASIII